MFWHTLALELGCSVAEAQARISSPEFTAWRAYHRAHPFGPEAADARHGALCAILANQNRKKNSRRSRATDFLLGRRFVRQASADSIMSKLKALAGTNRAHREGHDG